MISNLSIIINHLRPFMGDLTEEFLALELYLINKQYVTVENGFHGRYVSFSMDQLQVEAQDLDRLLEKLETALKVLVGPTQTHRIIEGIESQLIQIYL